VFDSHQARLGGEEVVCQAVGVLASLIVDVTKMPLRGGGTPDRWGKTGEVARLPQAALLKAVKLQVHLAIAQELNLIRFDPASRAIDGQLLPDKIVPGDKLLDPHRPQASQPLLQQLDDTLDSMAPLSAKIEGMQTSIAGV